MAIDDNTLYGVTGAQVKDLASKVKKGKSTIFYLDKTKDFWYGVVPPQKSGTTQVFADPENTIVVAGRDVLAASEKGAVFLGVPNTSYGYYGRYDIYPAAFISNEDEWDIYYIVSKYPSIQTNGVIGIRLEVFGNSSTTFDWYLTFAEDEQADWNDNVQVSPYYIKNKPTIPTVPTTVSSFTNDANYQNATQVSSAISSAIGQITQFSFEVVQTLPATGNTSTIYLVPTTGTAQNIYDEYIYVNNAWEKIGSTNIDLSNYVQFSDLATVATTGDYEDLTNLPEGMVVLEYGTSTWADFLAAYRDNRIVYCRASSGTDPSVGDKTRMAFMAYVTNPSNPTGVEFQYYRSVTTKSASSQTDQVVVYKLTNNGTWTVETRNTGLKIAAGTNMTSSYSGGVLTLNATAQAQQQSDWGQTDNTAVDFIKNKPTIPTVNDATLTIQKNGTNVATFTANASTNATANIVTPDITLTVTDPGEGAALAENHFIAVYNPN